MNNFVILDGLFVHNEVSSLAAFEKWFVNHCFKYVNIVVVFFF